ncbi:MAG: STAS domain-containing protein [Deltaproteobacteria bacterium]|nr:STAS domain-containing protein [Deltaproteobacteria bacterium]MBW2018035.1 STAS domain-containing protein [Deltaproteobacteria bacterium]MBW2128979.1 STAS domain-containing protein [Deltaproteobacteria bacterium]MBW2302926.1 STAS domain-containing protein [Deltaproteobacteria bacterium]
MDFSTEKHGDVVVLSLQGDVLDADNSQEFKKDIASVLESNKKVVFDMRTMRFIDSSGCGALLSCVRKLKNSEGDLKLFGLSEQVRSLFQIIRLDQILDIFDTKEEAVKAFES